MPDPVSFFEITPDRWEDAKKIGSMLRFCSFRGQSSSNWHLKTTMERAAEQFKAMPEAMWDEEYRMLSQFKSRAHQYIQSPPGETETLEWLALIRHYGGVARLLDFTESFYIASFFAIEDAWEDASVWAVNDYWIMKTAIDNGIELDERQEYPDNLKPVLRYAESFVGKPQKEDFVLKVVPKRLNERNAVQKGVFLFPCNLEKSFESNLCSTFKFPFDTLDSKYAKQLKMEDILLVDPVWPAVRVMKINLPRKLHREAISDLWEMNIDSASLIPGLEGFARSLKIRVRYLENRLKQN